MMVFTLFPSLLQMEVVSKHFEKTFDKTGVALTGGQLYEYAKSQKLGGITKRDIYNFLSTQKDVAQFGVAKKRGRDFTTISIVRPGIYHIDYGEFHKEWAGSNSGHTGFLVAVENFTNKLCFGQKMEKVGKFVYFFIKIDFFKSSPNLGKNFRFG